LRPPPFGRVCLCPITSTWTGIQFPLKGSMCMCFVDPITLFFRPTGHSTGRFFTLGKLRFIERTIVGCTVLIGKNMQVIDSSCARRTSTAQHPRLPGNSRKVHDPPYKPPSKTWRTFG
jgi:hypothetical protein